MATESTTDASSATEAIKAVQRSLDRRGQGGS